MLLALLLALAVPARARSRCARTSPPATASAMALSGGRARSIGRGTNSRGARNCSASVLQKAARLQRAQGAALPIDYRAVIVLRDVEGLSTRDVADRVLAIRTPAASYTRC